jgi:hypothetical protein
VTAHEETQTWLAWNQCQTQTLGGVWDSVRYAEVQWYGWNKAYCDQYRTVDRLTDQERVEYVADLKRQQLAAEEKRKIAAERAEELLFHFLTKEQIQQYRELGYFETVVDDKRVRLHKRPSGNIHILTADGKTEYKLCRHIADYSAMPIADVLLAQLLEMRAGFAAFERGANRS